jgi:hypothetical protein
MPSTINATTSGVVTTGDSVATLSLQTGGTTAVAIDSAQIVSLSKSLALLGSTSGSVALAAPATAGTQSYTLPTALPGTSGYALTSTTGGVMSWAAASGSPGGSTTQVQYNNTGAFAGSANMTFDGTTLTAAGFSGPLNGTVGATTASTGAFTTLSASSTVSGTGFSTYLASPPAIGGTAPAAGTFTTATARAAATQDSVVLQGRAGGTSSYAATITPTTLTASRTVTLPDASINFATGLPVANGGTGQTTASAAFDALAPSQTSNSGKYLTTNGTTTSWATVSGGSAATPTALGTVYGKTSSSASTVSLGYQAGNSIVNDKAVAIGYNALPSWNGAEVDSCLAIGYNALANHTTNGVNLAIGYKASESNTTGYYNTAIGKLALQLNTGGNGNVVIGGESGTAITGNDNVAIGRQANRLGTTGNYNIVIGSSSALSALTDSNEIIIGYNLTGKGANTGFINAGGGGVYQGNNATTWSITSDRRLKKNIVDNNVGLDAIKSIQVKNFEYRLPEEVEDLDANCAIDKKGVQLGVIAQELQTVLPDCVKQESTGVLGLQSDNLTWYMVNAIKQLSAALDAANERIAALEAK